MSDLVRVALAGATGRTGNAVAHALVADGAEATGIEIAACIAPTAIGEPTRPLPDGPAVRARVSELVPGEVDVLVDLTVAGAVPGNLEVALDLGLHVVLGTTGVDSALLEQEGERFAAAGLGLLYVPNFSIGALLMMRFAAEAARLMDDVEIVETHHATKLDAPSGTARRTAELVAQARAGVGIGVPVGVGGASRGDDGDGDGARGLGVAGVRVHSLRLPGAMAHQEVVLGSPGEVLTIRHDAIDRSCYAAGVARAARGVASFTGLVIGLEHVL